MIRTESVGGESSPRTERPEAQRPGSRMQQEFNWKSSRRILSISQIVDRIRFQLETEFEDVWVEGEVSNLRIPPSGHAYFTLKDEGSQLKAVCFRLQLQLIGITPKDGERLQARGRISVYPPRGEFQLVVEYMEPAGEGALQMAFERLKRRLEAAGLFAPEHKQKIPMLPSRVGIATSPTGAALRDILRVLKRRNNRLDILIYPCRVQGEEAAKELKQGVQYLDRRSDIDVILLARGGGSLEDLWAFNDEGLARAIHGSKTPVISAVGHEIDFTIADFVADERAPTPSAAAEIVSRTRKELQAQVFQLRNRTHGAIQLHLSRLRHRLQALRSRRVFVDAETRLRHLQQRLDEVQARLRAGLPILVPNRKRQVEALGEALDRHMLRLQEKRRTRLELARKELQAYSPQAVLERGYAVVSREATIIRRPAQIKAGQDFSVRVAGGEFGATRKE